MKSISFHHVPYYLISCLNFLIPLEYHQMSTLNDRQWLLHSSASSVYIWVESWQISLFVDLCRSDLPHRKVFCTCKTFLLFTYSGLKVDWTRARLSKKGWHLLHSNERVGRSRWQTSKQCITAADDCNDHIAQFAILNLKSDCAAEFFVWFILRVLKKKIENLNMCCLFHKCQNMWMLVGAIFSKKYAICRSHVKVLNKCNNRRVTIWSIFLSTSNCGCENHFMLDDSSYSIYNSMKF